MSHFTARRAAWLLPLVGAARTRVRGRGVRREPSRRRRADPRGRQLVHDQDHGSAARIRSDRVDHRPGDLRHAVHLQGQRPRPSDPAAREVVDGEQGREDVHLPAEEERALRRRHTAHVGGRRVLVQAAGQPEGEPVVPAGGRLGQRPRGRTRSSCTRRRRTPSCRRSWRTRRSGIVNSKLAKAHGASAAGNAAKADKAENWFNSSASVGAGSGPYELKAYSGTSQITLVPNTELLGREEAGVLERRRPQHDRGDPADQRPARLARDRDRSLVRPGPDAPGQVEPEGRRCSRRRGCSGCSRTTTRQVSAVTSNKYVPGRPSATRSTTSRSCRWPGRARSRRPGSSRRCSSAPCRSRTRSSRT